MRGVSRLALPLSLVLTLWLASGTAWAHALLQRSDPPSGSVVQRTPTRIHLWFSENLNGSASRIIVWDRLRHEENLGHAGLAPGAPRELEVNLKPLPPGSYLVLWTSVSADDGHILRGAYSFSVLVRGPLPSLAGVSLGGTGESFPDGSVLLSLLAHWLELLATVIWVGSAGFAALISGPVARGTRYTAEYAERQRYGWLIPVSVLALALASALVLVVQAYALANNDWGGIWTGATLANVFSAQYGTLWLARQAIVVLVLALCVAPVGVAVPRMPVTGFVAEQPQAASRSLPVPSDSSRSNAPWVFALGLLYIYLLAASGHAASVDIGGLSGSHLISVSVAVDWTHLLATSLWVGGQIYIAAVLIPAFRLREPGADHQSFLSILNRFSFIAYTSIAVFTLSGGFNGKVHIPSWYAYFHSVYGWTLTIKISLIATMMAISAYTVYRLRPHIRRTLASNGVESSTPLMHRLARWLRLNPVLGAGVLMASSVLFYYPVPLGLAPAGPSSYAVKGDGLVATVALKPDRAGVNTVTVRLLDGHGRPVTQATVVVLTTMLDMVMGTGRAPLAQASPGVYAGPADLGMGGNWRLLMLVYRSSGFSRLSVNVQVGT